MQELDPEAVRVHLARILESSGFVKADRLCRFLRFTVEAKLNGTADQIKEYVLGREVFDRNGDYDPRTDPIVRVEARRLRTRLEEYYNAAGRDDSIRFDFPKGSYVPVITAAASPVVVRAAVVSRKPISLWVAGVLVGITLVVAGYWALRPALSDIVAVAPASWLWGENVDASGMEESLAEKVSVEFANERAARVVGWPLMMRFRTERQEFRQMAAGVGATKMMLIRKGEPGVVVFVLDGITGEKIRVNEYSGKPDDLARTIVQDFVARRKKDGR